MNSRQTIHSIEDELVAEREAIQEESCTEIELQQIRAEKRRRGNSWRRWAVPADAKLRKCKDCGRGIWWRSEFGVAFPLEAASVETEPDGSQTAVGHWRVCG